MPTLNTIMNRQHIAKFGVIFMTNNIHAIVKAAREKFGDVMSVTLTEREAHGEFYFVACKRHNAPVADRPYMTITAKYSLETPDAGQVSFFWGHYDLTIEKVHKAIEANKAPMGWETAND